MRHANAVLASVLLRSRASSPRPRCYGEKGTWPVSNVCLKPEASSISLVFFVGEVRFDWFTEGLNAEEEDPLPRFGLSSDL